MVNSFRWVKFTVIGGLCAAVVSYALNLLEPLSAFQMLCQLMECGIAFDPYSENFNPIWFIFVMVPAFAAYLSLATSQAIAWRPLALPLVWWCLVSTGSQFVHNIPILLLVVLLGERFESGTEQLAWMMGTALLTLLMNLLLSAFTGLVVGIATALFIVPSLRRERDQVTAT